MSAQASGRGGYETFEHTADVGLKVWGASLKELFEQAAAGFIDVMLDPRTVRPERSVSIAATGEEPEELLVGWLEEILFAFEARGFAPATAHVKSLGEGELRGELLGEDLDLQRHELRQPVKAVTYHDLTIKRRGDLYEVRIVFDV